jgi:hypothetical protein
MRVPPQDVVRLMSVLARRADAVLVRSAARNAALSVEIQQVRRLDDVRTLRDLEKIPAARPRRETRAEH